MTLPILSLIIGLILLVWSADRFIDGAAAVAKYFGMPSLLIGMIIVGFGTSAPEMVVSALSALQGSPEIALGNAYGSNITNIGLIIGLTALVSPILVSSSLLRKELPLLSCLCILSAYLIRDDSISRLDAFILLGLFALFITWSIVQGIRSKKGSLSEEKDESTPSTPISKALMWLVIGLVLLVGSSQLLVWGAVEIATALGVDQIVIGLTIVAIGTSLPELAASLIAARKGEHDIALGNVIGSNIFNSLAVVGIAGSIKPMTVGPEVFYRDMGMMILMTILIFFFSFNYKKTQRKRINRIEGSILLALYLGYTSYLVVTSIA